jgi:hypothetical protein
MQRSHSAKPSQGHGAKRATKPQSPANEEGQPGDRQLALAFDVLVSDVALQGKSSERSRPAQELTEQTAVEERQIANVVQQLHTVQKLTDDTRRVIEKRIKEIRQMRRAAAA